MIELDANGKIPVATQFRVYIVAGFTDNRPFKGFNIWSNESPVTQKQIEKYETFQGWATDTLDIGEGVENKQVPVGKEQFRVGLTKSSYRLGTPVVTLHTGDSNFNPEERPEFLRWLTLTFDIALPEPVRDILVRFQYKTAQGELESLFITTQAELDKAFGSTVTIAVPGQSQGQAVTLGKKDFKQLSSDQDYLEITRKFARKDGTICGINPLKL